MIFFAKHLEGDVSDRPFLLEFARPISPICLKIPILTKLSVDNKETKIMENAFRGINCCSFEKRLAENG